MINSKKSYIVYAYSNDTGKSIYRENAKTQDEAIERGIDLSRRNSWFYYLVYEIAQTVIYSDSLFKETNTLIPIQKISKSTLIAECRMGVVLEYTGMKTLRDVEAK